MHAAAATEMAASLRSRAAEWQNDAKHQRLIREAHRALDDQAFDRAAELASRLHASQSRATLTSVGRQIGLSVVIQYFRHPGPLWEVVSRLQHPHAQVILHLDSSDPEDEVAVHEVLASFPSTRIVRSFDLHEVRAYNKVVLGRLRCGVTEDRGEAQRESHDPTVVLYIRI